MAILFIYLGLTCVGAADNQTADEIISQTNTNTPEILIAANETGTFQELDDEIDEPWNTLKLKKDYAFNPFTDPRGILVDRDNYVIDSDGHTINGMGKSAIFIIEANNITKKRVKKGRKITLIFRHQ